MGSGAEAVNKHAAKMLAFPYRGLIIAICLAAVVFIALGVRILPLRWGAYLSEFDSFWHFYVAEYIVENGLFSVFGWVDDMTWFPWGRDVAGTTPLGLPYTVVFFYLILKSLGAQTELLDVALYLPPFMAAATCLVLYFLGKDLGGKETGILAALFLALNEAYIGRTTLGFLKHETVGVFAIILASFLFLRSVDAKRSVKSCLIYAALAGLSVAYLNISWGAFWFILALIPLFIVALVVVGRYSPRVLLVYSLTMCIGIVFTLPFPRPGFGILTAFGILPVIGGFIILLVAELLRHIKSPRTKLALVTSILTVAAMSAVILYQLGFVTPLTAKIMTVIDPSQREQLAGPIVESVAEHKMSTWATFYSQFGNVLILAPLGFYLALKRRWRRDIYLVVAGVLSVYFASSFVRLTLIMAPFITLLGAYALVSITRPLAVGIKSSKSADKGKRTPRVSPYLSLATILILALLMTPTFFSSVEGAYAPVTIAAAGTPLREYRGDWLEALAWMRDNIPPDEPVLSWWDYGYWIAIEGDHKSIADNATLNTTQIASIGQILLSNETRAFQLAKQYFNARYIVIFVTTVPQQGGGHAPWLWGDEGKWYYIAQIAQQYYPEISIENADSNQDGYPDSNTLLGKAILYAIGEPWDGLDSEVVFVSSSHNFLGTNKVTTQVIILKWLQ
ncbi:MAG: STT3 domain-containing protein [Candidatus Bathyarchaeia archaeon]